MCLVMNGQDGNGTFFQVFALVSQIKSVKLILASFSFEIHLILFP